jgi:hypothetical protein
MFSFLRSIRILRRSTRTLKRVISLGGRGQRARVHYQYKAKLAKPILSNHLVRHPSGAVRKRTLTRPSLFPKSLGGPLVDEAEKAGVSINYEQFGGYQFESVCHDFSAKTKALRAFNTISW